MELSSEKLPIIETTASKVVVMAAAASGKTATLVARLQHLLTHGADPRKTVAITFTNAAAGEILDRLARPQGLFIGTIHSYANQLLMAHGISTRDIIENEQFNKLFDRVKLHPNCIKPVDYLLLDEAQDSTPEQFEFILNYVCPKNWMFVGDWRQSIYGWNGADPQQLIDLSKRPDVTKYELNTNYRNDRRILSFAQAAIRLAGIDYLDRSIPASQVDGKLIETVYEPLELARYIKLMDNYGSWFVLARTNEQVEKFSTFLEKEKVPFDTFKRSQFNNQELAQKMRENTVKVLTIHTAKGLEADNVAVIGARFYNTEEKCVSYVAATRARHLLIWERMPSAPIRSRQTRNWET